MLGGTEAVDKWEVKIAKNTYDDSDNQLLQGASKSTRKAIRRHHKMDLLR